uniref:ATP-binding cassette sub-family B member 6, mitochondrial n=1 Tax=Globodera pallida TaxID=36090 RepID=A0A183BIX0_GLOPA
MVYSWNILSFWLGSDSVTFWPFAKGTNAYFLFPALLITALVILNVLATVRNRFFGNRQHLALRSGSLPPFFYTVLLAHLLLVLLSLTFLLFVLFRSSSSVLPALFVAVFVHCFFWSFSVGRFWSNRHFHEQPTSLVVSYALFSFITTLPLFFWSQIFPNGPRGVTFLLYLFELIFTNFVLIAVVTKSTLKKDGQSSWANFVAKLLQIWPYVWPRKSIRLQLYVLICLFLLAIGRVINVLIPLYSKWIVDALSGPNPYFCYKLILVATTLKFLQGSGGQGGLLNTARTFIWLPIQQYTTIEIEVDMLNHLHNLSLRWHLSRKTGEMFVGPSRDGQRHQLNQHIVELVLPAILDILLAAAFFFSNFNAYFGFLVLVTMIIYLAFTVLVSEWRIPHRREMNECDKKAGAIGVDSLINYETIKHFNAETLETQRYREAYLIYQRAEYKANASLSLLNLCQNSIIGLGLIGGSLLAAFLITRPRSSLTAGDYVLFTTYLLQLYAPLNFFGTIYRVVQRSFIDMENMLSLFSEDIEIKDVLGAKELERPIDRSSAICPSPSIPERLWHCQRMFNDFRVGPSGSGKTTVVRLLFRLYDVTDGQILFNGVDIRQLKLSSVRDRIGIVPQDTVLFNDTIRYNIRYGRQAATDEDVGEAAKAAAIHQFIVSQPDGYDCLVGERGLKLSGGEKQRVAIARVVLKGPEYILLDEATSALDSKTERSIQHNLFELCNRRSCVIVAHRLSTIVHADKILVLSEGTVAESGSHSQLLELDGLYAEMWRLQNGNSEAKGIEPNGDG